MRFTVESLYQHGATEDEVSLIEKMHQGGSTGGAGYEYEFSYALYRLIEQAHCFICEGKGEGSVSVQGYCFVDDVIRDFDGHWYYSQLKTNPRETWGLQNGKLIEEFTRQKAICERIPETFHLELVTPHADRAQHFNENMPTNFQEVVKVVRFPSNSSVHHALRDSSQGLRRLLQELCPFGGSGGLSDLCALYFAFKQAWDEVGETRSAPRNVRQVLKVIHENGRIRLRNPALTLDQTTQKLSTSLQIHGLTITVDGGFLEWKYGQESGIIGPLGSPSLQRFFLRLSQSPPDTFERFEACLP